MYECGGENDLFALPWGWAAVQGRVTWQAPRHAVFPLCLVL